MKLEAGARLGHYEILSPLGAGGMGTVYKARDMRLERTVAVKVLHDSSRDLRERFDREARVVAALQHPHICALFDIGRHDGIDYLVMEHLEGDTLKCPQPLAKVLDYGAQIADALDAAHRKGVTHRDLKPANIMITRSGVKLLDFGIAKLNPVKPPGPEEATLTQALTASGTLIGTLPYMAPEQLEGRPADARTDIWALGAVLYEMVTGRRAFDGKSQASLIAAIVEHEPPSMTALKPITPPLLERAVKRCLAKEADNRWQSALDVKLELESIRDAPAVAAPARPRGTWLWPVVTAVLILLAVLLTRRLQPAPQPAHFQVSITPPPKTMFLLARAGEGGSALSPDGSMLAFSARTEGRMQLWVRRLDWPEPRAMPGTEGASYPFWSPDSRWIGFFTQDKLKKIEVSGGPAQTVCNVQNGRGGAWSGEGVILFASLSGRIIRRVPAAGGTPVAVTQLEDSRGEAAHYWPVFLPGGKRFLYWVRAVQAESTGIWAGSLDGTEKPRPIVATHWRAAFVPPGTDVWSSIPGQLLYLRERTLVAQEFDGSRMELRGEAFPVAESVASFDLAGLAEFSVSGNGMLVYGRGGGGMERLVWRDRSGKETGTLGSLGEYFTPRLSPDGRRALFSRMDAANTNLWMAEVERGTAIRFTFDSGLDTNPVWSPDGTTVAYRSGFTYRKAASGAGNPERLTTSPLRQFPQDWSADGRYLLFVELGVKSGSDLMVLQLGGAGKAAPFQQTQFNEGHGRFSPDGRWIAYTSDESGTREIYVQQYKPGQGASGARWQVSSGGGTMPAWRGDGRELYYLSLEGKMMAAVVKAEGAVFQSSSPAALFATAAPGATYFHSTYDVTRDGRRFLLIEPSGETAAFPLTLVINWQAARR